MLLLIRCSQSANRLQQFYQNWKFLSSVYSFITSPGTLPQEIVICFHWGILGPACSGVSWVSLFYYHRWKHIFPWCRGREAVIPKAKPRAWHLYLDWRLFSHFDALTTHPTALIFQTAGGSAMFLPPTTKSKTSQKSETQQPGAKSDSLRGFRVFLGRITFWWGQNRHLFLSFHLLFTINRMRIGKIIRIQCFLSTRHSSRGSASITYPWLCELISHKVYKGFPVNTDGKEHACQCRRHKKHEFNPWVGKIPWRGAWQPIPVFLLEESCGQRSPAGYSP